MLIQQKIRNLGKEPAPPHTDRLPLEWFETRKRILRRTTLGGIELSLKFLQENPELTEGDVLFESDALLIAVTVIPCNCIVIRPADLLQTAAVCYEIGNRHLPLYYDDCELLVPFDKPLMQLLQQQNIPVNTGERQLLHPLKTTVSPHGESNSLFSKIIKRTQPAS